MADLIRVGFQRNTPPFSYSPTARFEPVGYSVDLAHLVLTDIYGTGGYRVEAVEVTSSTRERLLLDHHIDIECGSTTITPARLERHAFSLPIFRTSHRIAVRAGAVRTGAVRPGAGRAGPGLRVVGIQGSTSQEALEREPDLGFGHTFTGVPSIGAARDAFLHAPDIDAIVADEVILLSLLEGAAADGVELLDARLGAEDYGFMIRSGDGDLRQAVDGALGRIVASGGLDRLRRTWLAPAGAGR